MQLISQQKNAAAVYVETPPQLDGHINDPQWKKAVPIHDFTQREPLAGKPPRFRTEVRILYDSYALYIGVMCWDDSPADILARELKWDGYISGDDNLKLIFDTFNDDRTAYWFGTNPLGSQDDALISGSDYSGFNEEWNGIWEVETAISDSGWSAEFLFPFASFKFHPDSVQQWGFNIQRGITRFGEDVLWTSWEADKGLLFISEAGNLSGMKNIERGDPIYVKPFITAGGQWTGTEETGVLDPGLDIKYGITKTLTLDLSVNTDFAQVESDRARINLTRFPLFFPEKREFFLEGRKFFEFSLGGRDQVFYSRRIGLKNGEEIPLIGGIKLFGRSDDFQVGLLTMQTAGKGDFPSTNFTAARFTYDILDQSYVGMILTNQLSEDGFNRALGADAEFRFNDFLGDKNLIIGANISTAGSGGSDKDSYAGRFFIDYPNDFIDQKFQYRLIQQNFRPAMGFIGRSDISSYSYYLKFEPRINFLNFKQLIFKPADFNLLYDLNGNHIGMQYYFSPFGIRTVENDIFSVVLSRNFDLVESSYFLFDSTSIGKGEYWFTNTEFNFHMSESRPIAVGASYLLGDYYNGSRSVYNLTLNYRLNSHITLRTEYYHNDIELGGNSFSTNEFAGRFRYDFSTGLYTSIFGQWNNELDELNVNYRLNWKPKIGSDLFIVINQLFDTGGTFRIKDTAVLLKFVYLVTL